MAGLDAARPVRRRNVLRMWRIAERRGCFRCGGADRLGFHHVTIRRNGDHRRKVSTMAWNGEKWNRVYAEIRRCVVLCASCHDLEHHAPTIRAVPRASDYPNLQKSVPF